MPDSNGNENLGYVSDANDFEVVDKQAAATDIQQNGVDIKSNFQKPGQVDLEITNDPKEEEDPWNTVPLFRVVKMTPWKGERKKYPDKLRFMLRLLLDFAKLIHKSNGNASRHRE